jgi:hypothetical protein
MTPRGALKFHQDWYLMYAMQIFGFHRVSSFRVCWLLQNFGHDTGALLTTSHKQRGHHY